MRDAQLACPECGAELVLKSSRYGQFYGCSRWAATGCSGSHGAHPDGTPLGVPADRATKRARMHAHEALDALWNDQARSPGERRRARRAAYNWLAAVLDLPAGEAHIGRFTTAQCEAVLTAVRSLPSCEVGFLLDAARTARQTPSGSRAATGRHVAPHAPTIDNTTATPKGGRDVEVSL